MIKTQYSRVINKRSEQTGVVPTIGPSNDHTDGTWLDTDIYPGEFYINMQDQIVWFGWVTGSTSGVTQIYPPPGPGGGITIVGGTGIQVSGASPNFAVSFNGNTTEFTGLTSGTESFTLGASATQFVIANTDTTTPAACYFRFTCAGIEATTYNGLIFESYCGWVNDGTGWVDIGGGGCVIDSTNDIDVGITAAIGVDVNGYLGVEVTNPAGVNDINYRVYWEYSLITA
jgi:hypothetical protein